MRACVCVSVLCMLLLTDPETAANCKPRDKRFYTRGV